MKILFHLGGENIGGNETLLYELASFLKGQGHSLILITRKGLASDFLARQFEAVFPIPRDFQSWQAVFQNQKLDCAFAFYGDIFKMARAAKLVQVKTLWCCGHPWDFNEIPIPSTLLFDLVVTQSEFLAKKFQEKSIPITVCQNGIDLKKFSLESVSSSADFRNKYQIPKSKFLIGYPARLAAYKRHSKALKILGALKKQNNDYHLVFAVGASVEEKLLFDEISKLAKLLGVESDLTWVLVPPAEMPAFYSALDLAIFPALDEGFGIGILEAMAMQLPVVASDSGGISEIIEHSKSGFCIEENDGSTASFVNSIRDLRARPLLRREVGQNARVRVERKFSVEKMNQRYLNLMGELIGHS